MWTSIGTEMDRYKITFWGFEPRGPYLKVKTSISRNFSKKELACVSREGDNDMFIT